jgi:hypothetical protein
MECETLRTIARASIIVGLLAGGCAVDDGDAGSASDGASATKVRRPLAEAAVATSPPSEDAGMAVDPVDNPRAVDAGGDPLSEATVPIGPIVAPDASDVVVWLDADRGVNQTGDKVTKWTDQSRGHSDFTQSSSQAQPVYVPAAVAGHAVVRFDRTRRTVLTAGDSTSLHFGTAGLTVLLAAADKNPVAGGHGQSVGTIFGKQQVGNDPAEITFAFNWFTTETTPDEPALHIGVGEVYAGAISNKRTYNDGTFRIITGSWRASGRDLDMSLRVNGKADGADQQTNAPDLSLVGQPIRLGESYGQATTADIGEVIVIKGTPALSEVEAWEIYLMTKYGVAR